MSHPPPVQPSAEALKQGYEPEGVHFWTLIALLTSIALVIALFMSVAAWLLLRSSRADQDREVAPSAIAPAPINTGLPPLQPSPEHNHIAAEDLILLHQHEDQAFDELGWKVQNAEDQPHVPDAVIQAVAARESAAGGGH